MGTNAGVSIEGQEFSQGSIVDLRWTPEHPWAARFKAQGARFHLFAQYLSGEQPVEQNLGVAAPFGTDAIRFKLPRTLRSVPDSPVCMFVSEARAASAVPVRLTAQGGGDTARFRYPDWEAGVRARTLEAQLDQEDAALDRYIRDAEGELRRLQALRASTGIGTIEDCRSTILPIPADTNHAPPDVVEPNRTVATTERICVRRARNMQRSNVDVERFIERWAGGATAGRTDRENSRIQRFRQHWARWHDRTGADYMPEIGSPMDLLPVAPILAEAIGAWIWDERSRNATNAGIIGIGLLTSYDGCLEDIEKQLRIKHEAWQRARENKGERDQLYRQWQESTCRTRIEAQAKARDAWSETLTEARNRKAAVQLRRNASQIPAAGGLDRRILNHEYCVILANRDSRAP